MYHSDEKILKKKTEQLTGNVSTNKIYVNLLIIITALFISYTPI